jgi:hypothetical protein
VLVARSVAPVTLTTRSRTFRMTLVRGARIVRGRYLSVVRATIQGERVSRSRPVRLR